VTAQRITKLTIVSEEILIMTIKRQIKKYAKENNCSIREAQKFFNVQPTGCFESESERTSTRSLEEKYATMISKGLKTVRNDEFDFKSECEFGDAMTDILFHDKDEIGPEDLESFRDTLNKVMTNLYTREVA
jgi:hypothetical protein